MNYEIIEQAWAVTWNCSVLRNILFFSKTSMKIENKVFKNVSPIKNGDFPLSCQFSGGYFTLPKTNSSYLKMSLLPQKGRDPLLNTNFH